MLLSLGVGGNPRWWTLISSISDAGCRHIQSRPLKMNLQSLFIEAFKIIKGLFYFGESWGFGCIMNY